MCTVCQWYPQTPKHLSNNNHRSHPEAAEHLQEMQSSCYGKGVSSKTQKDLRVKEEEKQSLWQEFSTVALFEIGCIFVPVMHLQPPNVPVLNRGTPQGYLWNIQANMGDREPSISIHLLCYQKQYFLPNCKEQRKKHHWASHLWTPIKPHSDGKFALEKCAKHGNNII